MASAPVRNPLVGFAIAILVTAGLSGIAGFVSTFIPYIEFRLFFLGFALFAAGAVAGRKTFLGSLGFVGAYLGAFVGFYFAGQLFPITPWKDTLALLVALGLALAAGAGGFMMGKIGVQRLERIQRVTPGLRRCSSCGARVGVNAHKCWSCKATLTY